MIVYNKQCTIALKYADIGQSLWLPNPLYIPTLLACSGVGRSLKVGRGVGANVSQAGGEGGRESGAEP